MANFQFIISPPTKKTVPNKVERFVEEIPKLILAPFNPIPEVKFGDVIVNAKATRNLVIFNSSAAATFVAQFGNIEPDDRIFVSESEIKLQPREERQIFITWGPIRSGYLRKVIRVHDMTKKARSFDVVLRGMAINSNQKENGKRKKMNSTWENRNLNSTITLAKHTNQKRSDMLQTVRRQTYTVEEKENQLPNNFRSAKSTFDACFQTYQKDLNSLNTLNENSVNSNILIQSFQSCDSVDAPVMYSNFESELAINAHTSDKLNSLLTRRSTLSMNFNEELEEKVNLSPTKNDYFTGCENILSLSIKDESEKGINLSTPINSCFSDSINENYFEMKPENVTFDMKTFDKSVFLTPQKDINLDSFILSPPSTLADMPRSVSKSTNYLHESSNPEFSFKIYKRDDLFFISPPKKSYKRSRKSPEENLFPYRTGSSAISDRKKHLRTSFMCRKKTSPNSVFKTRGSCGISHLFVENTIEKVKTRNPQTFKQAVTSHCYIDDPFIKQVLYNDDKWVEKQEKDIIKWMNSVLVPSVELSEENSDWTVNAADMWLNSCRMDESSKTSISNKVPPMYSMPQTLDILRKRRKSLITSEPVRSVFKKLSIIIDQKIISVRDDRDLHADEGLKNKLFQLLSSYDPQWLRIGLEAVYNQEIALHRKADVGGLGLFIRKNVLNMHVSKKNGNYKEVIKKSILLKFLKLVYFMDQARVQKLIRHNPRLFTLKSKYKSSQDLLSAFCTDLVIGRGYVMKHLKAISYILYFKQTCIDEYDYTIKSLDDLKDGVRLARLCEILFMESDLCSKLRVPAIDIENKKHNVQIAMKAAKMRCKIEGNIIAEDIVLGNRAGSRMKTLSFLWQIINNYLTPLYEKATLKIQRWWRKGRLRFYIQNFIVKKKTESAIIIQSAWRNYRIRKQSAVKIQRWYRAIRSMRIERTRYLVLKNAVCFIQNRYRAKKVMLALRSQFLMLRKHVTFIQQKFRSFHAMKLHRRRYLNILKVTIFLQRKFRANMLAKYERSQYLELRNSAILVQQKFRAKRDMIIRRSQFIVLRTSAVVIQRRFKAVRAMRLERQYYLRILKAIIFIQRKFRANKIAKLERSRYAALKDATVFVQRKFRANMARNTQMQQYITLKKSTIFVQQKFRACKAMKLERDCYLRYLKAILFVQRKFRATQLSKLERSRYLLLKNIAILIQRKFRAIRVMKVEHIRYLTLLKTIIFVQQKFRANQLAKLERSRYEQVKIAVTTIQQRYRAVVLMKKTRLDFLRLKISVIKIQQNYRALKLMQFEKNKFEKLKASVLTIQRKFRALLIMRECKSSYLKLKFITIIIQKRFRTLRRIKAFKIHNSSKGPMKPDIVKLDLLPLKICDKYEVTLEAFSKMIENRVEFLLMKMVAEFIQQRFRTKIFRNRFLILKNSVIRIQRWWRAILSNRLVPEQIEETNSCSSVEKATIKIQALWRGFIYRKMNPLPKRTSICGRKVNKENPDSKITLGERYKKAIYQMKTSDLYSVITIALWNLGWYWIDPNSGMQDDAMYVFCNITAGGETCIYPDVHSSRMPNIPWRRENEKGDWYSNLRGGFKGHLQPDTFLGILYGPPCSVCQIFIHSHSPIFVITYETTGTVQMTFLRLLHEQARQNFTYTCINSVAWFNSKTATYEQSLKLLVDNDGEVSFNSSHKPSILRDGCKYRKGKSETVFEISTRNMKQLPIIDFYPMDYGMPNQAFGFEIGPLCFK